MSSVNPFAVLALAAIVIRLLGDRSERARRSLRGMYGQDSPIAFRNVLSLVPLWATGALGLQSLAFAPPSLGQWLVLLALGPIEFAFLLSYRVPAPFMPRWLRAEVEEGVTPVARPARLDWLLFWIVLPVIVLGDVAILILIVVNHGASSSS